MGSASSKNASASPKFLGSESLASIARLWNGSNGRGLLQYRQDVDLREELEVMKRTLEDKIASLTQERDKAIEDIAGKTEALTAAQRERDEARGHMEESNKRSKVLGERIEGLNEQLVHAQDQSNRLKEQLARREAEVRIATNEVTQIKIQHSQTTALLDSRTAELKGAQAFLTKADSTSGADVVRMVEGLDAEIHQTAAFIADHFVFDERQEMTEEVQEACERVGELIGPKMVDLLGSTEHAEDPMLIQLACQALATAYCRWIIMSWDFEDHNFDQFLNHIYLTVQGAESQAIAGRWRALTRTHVHSMLHGGSDVSSTLVPHIANSLVDVLLVAGLRATPEQIHDVVMTTFGEKLTTIVRLALGLNWVIGKEITSANLDPITIKSKEVFDPTTMVDVNGEGERKVGGEIVVEHVLCTTSLGLQRVAKSSKEGETPWQTILLLKPKVALESVMENSEVNEKQITESPEGMEVHELTPNGHS